MNHQKTTIFITQKPTENHQNPTSKQQKLWDFEAPMELLDTTALSCKLCSWVAAWSTAANLLGIVGIFHPKWGYVISKDGNIMGISWKCQRFFWYDRANWNITSYLWICARKTRWNPRTRMLTRMVMVQMSKHMVMQSRTIPACNSLFEQSCTCFPCYQSAVWSGKCRVWSVECEVRSVECKVWSGECRVCKV